MTDNEIIKALRRLSLEMTVAHRLAEAEFLDQAIARIMSIPSAVAQLYPKGTWQGQYVAVVDAIQNRNEPDYE